MVGSGNIGCSVGEFMEVLHKLCNVLCSSIADNLFGHSKSFPDVIAKVLGHLWCGNGVSSWDENDHFGKSINNN